MAIDKAALETYFQCPYCNRFHGGHEIRVPRSVGKYRVKIIYDNILVFKCGKCGRVFKYEIVPQVHMWEHMTEKERKSFKVKFYTNYKGGIKINDKKI